MTRPVFVRRSPRSARSLLHSAASSWTPCRSTSRCRLCRRRRCSRAGRRRSPRWRSRLPRSGGGRGRDLAAVAASAATGRRLAHGRRRLAASSAESTNRPRILSPGSVARPRGLVRCSRVPVVGRRRGGGAGGRGGCRRRVRTCSRRRSAPPRTSGIPQPSCCSSSAVAACECWCEPHAHALRWAWPGGPSPCWRMNLVEQRLPRGRVPRPSFRRDVSTSVPMNISGGCCALPFAPFTGLVPTSFVCCPLVPTATFSSARSNSPHPVPSVASADAGSQLQRRVPRPCRLPRAPRTLSDSWHPRRQAMASAPPTRASTKSELETGRDTSPSTLWCAGESGNERLMAQSPAGRAVVAMRIVS